MWGPQPSANWSHYKRPDIFRGLPFSGAMQLKIRESYEFWRDVNLPSHAWLYNKTIYD